MAIHNVEITNVYKNDIIHKNIKKKKTKHLYSMLLLLLVPVLAMGCLRLYSETALKDVYITVCNLYNPIYSPYAETGNITFAWNYTFDNNVSDLDLPIHSSDIKIEDDGTIKAKVKESILVKSVADGVVTSIDDKDGVNVLKIQCSDNLIVEYINVDVLGVAEGNIIKRGKEVGTAKLAEELKIKIYLGNNQLKDLKIENNKIVWQS